MENKNIRRYIGYIALGLTISIFILSLYVVLEGRAILGAQNFTALVDANNYSQLPANILLVFNVSSWLFVFYPILFVAWLYYKFKRPVAIESHKAIT